MIPNKSNPESIGDLRNISCTLLASKIFESYVLDWLKAEVSLRPNRHGEIRGVGTDLVMVQAWQEILQNLDDYRAATVVTSIDYSKAFNRISFQHCLVALVRNRASMGVIRIVASFLSNRSMTVKVGQVSSAPRAITGGCPQGSILGVFLFNGTIDDLEAGCDDLRDDCTGSPQRQPVSESSDSSEDGDSMEMPAFAASNPLRTAQRQLASTESPIIGLHERIGRRNVLRSKRQKVGRLNITGECRVLVPGKPNHKTEAKWIARAAKLLRFVDHGFTLSKINFENSFGFEVNSVKHRVKHAVQAQRLLVRQAEEIGMVVNSNKTTLVCFSDSLSYKSDAYIEDTDLNRNRGQPSMKMLGLRLSNRPDMQAHVDWIKKSVRSRYWILRNKKTGFTEDELLTVQSRWRSMGVSPFNPR